MSFTHFDFLQTSAKCQKEISLPIGYPFKLDHFVLPVTYVKERLNSNSDTINKAFNSTVTFDT